MALTPATVVNCASQIKKKNFQNSLPTLLLLDELITQAIDGFYTGAAIGQ